MRSHTQPWPQIVSFYADLVQESCWAFEPMVALVEFIASPPYAEGLFAYTSHATLCIGRSKDFETCDNELKIQFIAATNTFHFTYMQHAADRSSWSRACSAKEWQPVLVRILHARLRWFHGAAAA
jgi:hypothetical protein